MIAGLSDTQRLLDAQLLFPIGGTPQNLIVGYELVLEELCAGSCEEQVQSSTLLDDLSSYMAGQFENGSFTVTLLANYQECVGA